MNTPSAPHPIEFKRESPHTSVLKTTQWLPRSLEDVFDFFSRPENLQRLTPSHLSFNILTPSPIEMRQGLEISYKLKVHGIPMRWTSLIETWNPPHEFSDRQLKGPYIQWVHSHRFRTEGDGTLVEDFIRFKSPGGRLVEKLLIQKDLASIFRHRQKVLIDLFPVTA